MAAEYKIETKPTIWQVCLQQGAYSDRDEQDYFIRANDRDEAWHLFKKFWSDIIDVKGGHEWSRGNLLVYVDTDDREVERFQPKNWSTYMDDDDEPDFDTYYGNAWKVTLCQLNVVEFRR